MVVAYVCKEVPYTFCIWVNQGIEEDGVSTRDDIDTTGYLYGISLWWDGLIRATI